jgi:hypothetical protein
MNNYLNLEEHMDQLINLILLVASSIVAVVALLAAINLLLPGPVQKVQQNLEGSLGRSTLLGLVNFLFFGALLVLFVWLADTLGNIAGGIFIFLAGLIGLGIIVPAVFGLAAFANLLGGRIGDESGSPFKANLRGGLLLVLAGIAPYVGWLIFTPLIVWAGLGSSILALARKREKESSFEEAAK